MFTVLETLFLRHPKIHYTAPPVCDADFSSSGGPSIVLNDIGGLSSPTGVVLGGIGGVFLSWNSYPGALCYSIYKSTNPDDPFGTYTILFECLSNPPVDLSGEGPGWFRISAITPDGETPLSPPIHLAGGGGGFVCPTIDGPPPSDTVSADEGDVDVILGPFPVSEGSGAGAVNYEWFKDGVFFLDTTGTTKSFLQFDEVTLDDTGSYTLHLSNDQPSCNLVSEPIVLDVGDGGDTICFPTTNSWWSFDAIVGIGFADTLFSRQINMTGSGIIQNPLGHIGKAAQFTSVAGTHDNPGLTGGATTIGAADLTGGISLAFWVRFDLDFGNTGVDMQFANLQFYDSSNVLLGSLLVQYIASTQTFGVSSGAATAAINYVTSGHVGVWNFIHATLQSGSGKVAISFNNGVPVVSVLNTTLAGAAAKITNAITMNPAANLVNSQTSLSIDEYVLFGRRLQLAEVTSVYNGGNGIACPFPFQPTNISIHNFDASLFTACGGQPASGAPAWDGTFSLLNSMDWENTTVPSFKGQAATFIAVTYEDGTFPIPGPTGCGYILEIALTSVDSWFGYKTTGLTPIGTYVRDPSSCSPGPATLEIK